MNYLLLDIGGSSIKYALSDENAHFAKQGKVKSPRDNLDHLFDEIEKLYRSFDHIDGIGISLPGVIDPARGYAYTSGALNYYNDTEFVKLLQERIPVPITIGNDAKCAANAEVGFGCLQDVDDAIVIVLGTGIGGCLVKDHQVVIGKHFAAGEASVVLVNARDGVTGDNIWASHNGIVGLLKSVQNASGSDEELSGVEIFDRANKGDEKVIAGIDAFAKDLCVQIYNIHTWFDSEKVAIGGGISAQPLLFELIHKNIDEMYDRLKKIYYPGSKPNVVKCQYGNDANLIGALYQHLKGRK